MTDNRTNKKKYSFNVIDVLIILAVIAVIGGVILRYGRYREEKESMTKDTFIVTLKASGEAKEKLDAIKEGDAVSFVNGGEFLYTIEKVTGEKTRVELTDEEGKLKYVEFAEKEYEESDSGEYKKLYDVTLEIKVKGEIRDDGYYIGGSKAVAVGDTVAIYSPGFCLQGKVINMETP